MSLSAHEKTQFERLTAGLNLGDPVALKKMAKRERATTMSHFALPRISAQFGLLMHTLWILLPIVAGIAALVLAGVGNFVAAGVTVAVMVLLLGAHFLLANRQ